VAYPTEITLSVFLDKESNISDKKKTNVIILMTDDMDWGEKPVRIQIAFVAKTITNHRVYM
jgi:hypothetical protein